MDKVIEQQKSCCEESDPEIDQHTNMETSESEQQRFEAYDEFEFDNSGLSWLVVESLLPHIMLERISTRFGNNEEFESYPDQNLFMMAFNTCYASVQCNIAGVQLKFDALTFDSLPVEDVTELATKALCLIHILAGLYVLHLNLGTKLIK